MTDPTIAALIEADKHRTPLESIRSSGRQVLGRTARELLVIADAWSDADAAFIAAAANAMPAIVAMVHENKRLEDCAEAWEACYDALGDEIDKQTGTGMQKAVGAIERLRAELSELRDANNVLVLWKAAVDHQFIARQLPVPDGYERNPIYAISAVLNAVREEATTALKAELEKGR